jgi:hypothetical protein
VAKWLTPFEADSNARPCENPIHGEGIRSPVSFDHACERRNAVLGAVDDFIWACCRENIFAVTVADRVTGATHWVRTRFNACEFLVGQNNGPFNELMAVSTCGSKWLMSAPRPGWSMTLSFLGSPNGTDEVSPFSFAPPCWLKSPVPAPTRLIPVVVSFAVGPAT